MQRVANTKAKKIATTVIELISIIVKKLRDFNYTVQNVRYTLMSLDCLIYSNYYFNTVIAYKHQ